PRPRAAPGGGVGAVAPPRPPLSPPRPSWTRVAAVRPRGAAASRRVRKKISNEPCSSMGTLTASIIRRSLNTVKHKRESQPRVRGGAGPTGRSLMLLLREHGIQPSAQRVAVAGYILNSDEHPSADRVWTGVRRVLPMISR